MKKIFVYGPILVFLFACSSNVEPIGDNEEEPLGTLEQPESPIDYSSTANWAFHPDQTINFLSSYNLDIGIINKDLELENTISIENNAKIDTGVDVFFVHPTIWMIILPKPKWLAWMTSREHV